MAETPKDNEVPFPQLAGGEPRKVKADRANGVTTIPEGAIPFDAAMADLEQLRVEADEALAHYAQTEVPFGLPERKRAMQRLLQAVRLYTAAHVTQGVLRQDAEMLAAILLLVHDGKDGPPTFRVPKITIDRLYATGEGFGLLKQDEGESILLALSIGDPGQVLEKAAESAVAAGADGIEVQVSGDVPADLPFTMDTQVPSQAATGEVPHPDAPDGDAAPEGGVVTP